MDDRRLLAGAAADRAAAIEVRVAMIAAISSALASPRTTRK